MSDGIFIVIATFGVVFVITAAMLQGLITTVDLLRAGFKGRRQSQVMVLLARFIVVPLVLVGLAAIVQLGPTGYGPQVDMAVCVLRPRIISVGRSCDLDLCARFDRRHSARDGRIGQAI